jgi:hypothetical protein
MSSRNIAKARLAIFTISLVSYSLLLYIGIQSWIDISKLSFITAANMFHVFSGLLASLALFLLIDSILKITQERIQRENKYKKKTIVLDFIIALILPATFSVFAYRLCIFQNNLNKGIDGLMSQVQKLTVVSAEQINILKTSFNFDQITKISGQINSDLTQLGNNIASLRTAESTELIDPLLKNISAMRSKLDKLPDNSRMIKSLMIIATILISALIIYQILDKVRNTAQEGFFLGGFGDKPTSMKV